MKTILSVLAVLLVAGNQAWADVKLPHIFGDNMVLQQGVPVKLWGWASPGEMVAVSFGKSQVKTTADAQGNWKLELPPQRASFQKLELVVKGNNLITLKNVLVGEVWLCSGQSNMSLGIVATTNPEAVFKSCSNPDIRLFRVKERNLQEKQNDIVSDFGWRLCSPQTLGEGKKMWQGVSAVGYFFARELFDQLKVPIGIIDASRGDTRIDPWIPAEKYNSVSPELFQAFKVSQKDHRPHQMPGALFNAMINGLAPFPISGFLWCQGESGHPEGMLYLQKSKLLEESWRELWGNRKLPFHLVQIGPYDYQEPPQVLPEFWEAQYAVTQQVPDTDIVCTNDIGDVKELHFPDKRDVGLRLARLALKKSYGRNIAADTPVFKSFSVEGPIMRISFENLPNGLKTNDNKPVRYFQIADAEKGEFVNADAKIDGKTIVLSAPGVTHPAAVRYAWTKFAVTNLVSTEGLPVYPFQAGNPRRCPENLLANGENLTDHCWRGNASITPAAGPHGEKDAFHFNIGKGFWVQIMPTALAGHRYLFSVWLKSATGGESSATLRAMNDLPDKKTEKHQKFKIGNEWERVSMEFDCPEEGNYYFQFGFEDGNYYLWHPQVEDVTGRTSPAPGPYSLGPTN